MRRDGAVVAGVLSGTSADGIDVALVRLRLAGEGLDLARPELIAFATLPFSQGLRQRVRAVLDGERIGLGGVALLDRDLGREFGRAVSDLARRHGVTLDLVGSHGQTVWHHDGAQPSGPATLQLGGGCYVAEAVAAPVVSDFRQRDVARGFEGAPVTALVDDLLFPAQPRPAAVLNLGGIANATPLGSAQPMFASFDVGPAGALLDGLARRLLDRPFDEDGATAARGTPAADFVAAILAHPFYERFPPKTTGRDTFGEAWLDRLLAGRTLSAPDALASGVHALARSVVAAQDFMPARPEHLWLAGGGARNATFVRVLKELAPFTVADAGEAGVDPDAREAIAFAVLGARRVLGTSALGKLSA